VFGTELPLLGDKLKDSYEGAVQFINNLESNILNNLHAKLDAVQNKTPELIREALVEALGLSGLNVLQDQMVMALLIIKTLILLKMLTILNSI
jgi:hypothetical protein